MRPVLLGLLLLTAGCAHQAAKSTAGSGAARPKLKTPPKTEAGVELAISPAGLMKDDGVDRIQKALIGKGYLEAPTGKLDTKTSEAIRKFQEDKSLARTGAPDRETVRKLGIKPNDVFKAQE